MKRTISTARASAGARPAAGCARLPGSALPTFLSACSVLALLSGCASPPADAPPPLLPLRTLRLYETGVGYFERTGSLAGSSPTALPVPAGHLDDALKTLVVLDEGGRARVSGVAFDSSVSRGMARAMAGLSADAESGLGMQELLVGLKGARVAVVTAKGTDSGRLVEVAATSHGAGQGSESGSGSGSASGSGSGSGSASGSGSGSGSGSASGSAQGGRAGPDEGRPVLVLLTDDGELKSVPMAAVVSVRPLDPSYKARLTSALDALSTRSAQNERWLRVLAHRGPVTLGYVAETPVWRATYRLVLASGAPGGATATGGAGGKGAGGVGTATAGVPGAVLQGWALLHNDTDEDWRGVRVQLANGRPDAFVFPLAAPRYARRPLITPDQHLATVPQLLQTTADALWGEPVEGAEGAGGLGLSGVGEGGGGRGEGISLGSVGTIGHGSGTGTASGSTLLEVGNLAGVAQAEGVEAGALFVYTLAEPVDVKGRGSALVPFEQEPVAAEPLALFDAVGSAARSAVHFTNSTRQTLPPGTLAVFGDGGFAGESALPRLKPGEERYLSYGMDLDVDLTSAAAPRAVEEPRRLVWRRESRQLGEHFIRTSDLSYEIKNRSGRPRLVVLAAAFDTNATLSGTDRLAYDEAAGRPLLEFSVPAQTKVTRSVHAVEGLVRWLQVNALTSARLGELAGAASVPTGERAPAAEAAARLRDAERDDALAAQAKADMAQAEKDTARLRDDMKAASGERAAAGQASPFAARVLAGEDRIVALRERLAKLEADAKARRLAAEEALARLPP